jgi:hypothetical protein
MDIEEIIGLTIITLFGLAIRAVWKKVANSANKDDIESIRTAFSGIKKTLEDMMKEEKQDDKAIWTELDNLNRTVAKIEAQVEIILKDK